MGRRIRARSKRRTNRRSNLRKVRKNTMKRRMRRNTMKRRRNTMKRRRNTMKRRRNTMKRRRNTRRNYRRMRGGASAETHTSMLPDLPPKDEAVVDLDVEYETLAQRTKEDILRLSAHEKIATNKKIISFLPSNDRLFKSDEGKKYTGSELIPQAGGQEFLNCLNEFPAYANHPSTEFADIYFFIFMIIHKFPNFTITTFFVQLFNKLSQDDRRASLIKLQNAIESLIGQKALSEYIIIWYQDSKTNLDCDDEINGLLLIMCGATILDLSNPVSERVEFQKVVKELDLAQHYYFQEPNNESGSLYFDPTNTTDISTRTIVSVFGNKLPQAEWLKETTKLSLTSTPSTAIPLKIVMKMFSEIDSGGYVYDLKDVDGSVIKPFAKGVPFKKESLSERYEGRVMEDRDGWAMQGDEYILGAPDFTGGVELVGGKLPKVKLIPISDTYNAEVLVKTLKNTAASLGTTFNILCSGDPYRTVDRKSILGGHISSNSRNPIKPDVDEGGNIIGYVNKDTGDSRPKTYDIVFYEKNTVDVNPHTDTMLTYL